MTNKIEDIIKTKNQTHKNSSSQDDMFSKLKEERDRKSLPNRFQNRQNDPVIENKKEKEQRPNLEFKNPIKIVDTTTDYPKEDFRRESFSNSPKKSNRKIWKYLISSIVFLGIVFFVFNFFSNIKVFITPKVESFVFENEKFNAVKNKEGSLPFEVMIVESTEEKEIVFSEKTNLSTKAKGTVVIYNEYSATPQKLLINTRLSDDKGLIYMTDKQVTIPGYTKSGSKIIPGSVVVSVTAQEVGDKYNSQMKDFKVVGFKGTSKYEKIYARAKTSFSGGVSGTFYTPNDTEKGEISSGIEIKLRESLARKIEAELPEGYIYYPDGMQFSFNINKDAYLSKTENAKVESTGKLATIIFKQEDLKKAIIEKSYPNSTEQDIKEIVISEIKNLKFKFTNPEFLIAKDTQAISFELSGDFNLAWHPIKEELAQKLVGLPRKDLEKVLSEDPGVSKVRIIFTPPWQTKVPKDINKIKIIEE